MSDKYKLRLLEAKYNKLLKELNDKEEEIKLLKNKFEMQVLINDLLRVEIGGAL